MRPRKSRNAASTASSHASAGQAFSQNARTLWACASRNPASASALPGRIIWTNLASRLQHELTLGVALLRAACGNEWIERAPLVVVDPVQRPTVVVLEGKDRAERALSVAAGLQRPADGVDADDEVVERASAQHQPAKP